MHGTAEPGRPSWVVLGHTKVPAWPIRRRRRMASGSGGKRSFPHVGGGAGQFGEDPVHTDGGGHGRLASEAVGRRSPKSPSMPSRGRKSPALICPLQARVAAVGSMPARGSRPHVGASTSRRRVQLQRPCPDADRSPERRWRCPLVNAQRPARGFGVTAGIFA